MTHVSTGTSAGPLLADSRLLSLLALARRRGVPVGSTVAGRQIGLLFVQV